MVLVATAGLTTGPVPTPRPRLDHATLTRYGRVLYRGEVATWDHDTVAGEQVFWDVRLGVWVMVYAALNAPIAAGGVARIGFATSPDLLHWTKSGSNPVFSPTTAEAHIATAGVVQLGDETYRMYYQTYGGTPDDRIYAASSDDLIGWSRLNGGVAVLPPGAAGEWDDHATFDPAPALIGTTTYLWYAGSKTADSSRGIGLATAPDGVTFTRQGRIFTPQAGEANASFGAPALLVDDATHYRVWHDAALTGTPTTRRICLAATTDGSVFTFDHAVLEADPSGWDSVQVFDAAPVVSRGVLYLFYCGSAVSGPGTGLAPDVGLATMAWP